MWSRYTVTVHTQVCLSAARIKTALILKGENLLHVTWTHFSVKWLLASVYLGHLDEWFVLLNNNICVTRWRSWIVFLLQWVCMNATRPSKYGEQGLSACLHVCVFLKACRAFLSFMIWVLIRSCDDITDWCSALYSDCSPPFQKYLISPWPFQPCFPPFILRPFGLPLVLLSPLWSWRGRKVEGRVFQLGVSLSTHLVPLLLFCAL